MTCITHDTMIEGKKYRLNMIELDNGHRQVFVRSVRVQEDGTEINAFLSIRQRAAEARARSRFAKEIKDWLGA